jgi:ubiquinone/menaquinone biosynthesis C-methylase UbiE
LADIAFMCNVFHELDGDHTLLEVGRMLKPGGKLAVIDWKKKREEDGPPYHHRLSAKEAIARCRDAGFTFAGEFKTGSDRRYGLIFLVKP